MGRMVAALAALSVLVVAVRAAGGEEASSSPSRERPRIFAPEELSRLALQPSDRPLGLRYARDQSGRKSLQAIGFVLPREIAQVRRLGLVAVYDAIFLSSSDRRLGTRLWLFRSPSGAGRWMAQTREKSLSLRLAPIPAPPLGDESWAVRGPVAVAAGAIISHAFRVGNLVEVVSLFGTRTPPTPREALIAARAALARLGR